jgi:hypothetical protein
MRQAGRRCTSCRAMSPAINTAIELVAIFAAATVELFRSEELSQKQIQNIRDRRRQQTPGASAGLGDLRGAREQVIDASHERISIEGFGHHVADPESRECFFGRGGHCCEEQDRNVDG